jgi:LacI family transcriptional regulator
MDSINAQPQHVTIRDVAAHAHVALSSVSHALSGHPDVSEQMRQKVENAARELGYEPNIVAQSLRSGVTRTIGFVVRDISNPMFTMLARACEQELRCNGYSMILVNSEGSVENESKNFELLRRRRVDGIIASVVAENSPYIKKNLTNAKCPIVLLDRQVPGMDVSTILVNHSNGVYDAVTQLISRGHRNIAFITGSTNVYPTRSRLDGIKRAFQDANLELPSDLIVAGGFDKEFALAHSRTILSRDPQITAIIAGGHGALLGITKALKERNLRMGSDISFIALDEFPYLEIFADEISTVYRDPEIIGKEAARLVLEGLQGESPRTAIIDTRFIERQSSQGVLQLGR